MNDLEDLQMNLSANSPAIRTPSGVEAISGSVICTADRGVTTKENSESPKVGFKVDWLQLTFPSHLLEEVLRGVQAITRTEFQRIRVPKEQGYFYAEESSGVRVYSNNRYGKQTCCIAISGSADPSQFLHLSATIHSRGGKVTRIDFAFDDFGRFTSMDRIRQSWQANAVATRYQQLEERKSYDRGCDSSNTTLYLGSRTSETSIRVYEKTAAAHATPQSKCGTTCLRHLYPLIETEVVEHLRWEMEVKGSTAERIFDDAIPAEYSECPPTFPQRCIRDLLSALRVSAIELLASRVSFRKRSRSSNISRAPLQIWWDEFLKLMRRQSKYQQKP